MKEDEQTKARNKLLEFRDVVYKKVFDYRSDGLMNLLDALCSNTTAKSVVELSLNSHFERGYSSVYDSIENYDWGEEQKEVYITVDGERIYYDQEEVVCHIISGLLPGVGSRGFHLIGLDGTSMGRPHSRTLAGREYVYEPNVVPGVKPLTVGYKNASVVYFPEEEGGTKWVVPLLMNRIEGEGETEQSKGVEQLEWLLSDPKQPFKNELVVAVNDSNYSNVPFLYPLLSVYENLVNISRSRGNRVFYWPAKKPAEGEKRKRGRPAVYGERFALKDSETWGEPSQSETLKRITAKGKVLTIELRSWSGLIMKGKKGMPMGDHEFTLVQVKVYDSEGNPFYNRPMWLIVAGKRRGELSLTQVYDSYIQRFDQEHYFRFSKQNLFLNRFQATDPQHLKNWEQLTMIAYVQLWLARDITQWLPRPWEIYLPVTLSDHQSATPSVVRRDMGRIIDDLGTPAVSSKPRGKSPGRPKGHKSPKKTRHPIRRKSKKSTKAA